MELHTLGTSLVELVHQDASNLKAYMAHKHQGQLTPAPQWWKHLKDWKRVFWKSERQAQKQDTKKREKE